ncbi:MAG: hypothetical protein IPM24_11915 [Bryobacterales bacterium]|nr:hypothetical protein [Bryobacterales bacterium]
MTPPFKAVVDHFLSGGFVLQEAVEMLERNLIATALERTKGNRSEASKLLGIHRNTLQRKLAEYGLDAAPPAGRRSR